MESNIVKKTIVKASVLKCCMNTEINKLIDKRPLTNDDIVNLHTEINKLLDNFEKEVAEMNKPAPAAAPAAAGGGSPAPEGVWYPKPFPYHIPGVALLPAPPCEVPPAPKIVRNVSRIDSDGGAVAVNLWPYGNPVDEEAEDELNKLFPRPPHVDG